MTAEEALEIIVDLIAKATPELPSGEVATVVLGDIETIAISYDNMDYATERDLGEDEGWYQGIVTLKSSPTNSKNGKTYTP